MIKTLISVEKNLKPKNFLDIGSFMGYYSVLYQNILMKKSKFMQLK